MCATGVIQAHWYIRCEQRWFVESDELPSAQCDVRQCLLSQPGYLLDMKLRVDTDGRLVMACRSLPRATCLTLFDRQPEPVLKPRRGSHLGYGSGLACNAVSLQVTHELSLFRTSQRLKGDERREHFTVVAIERPCSVRDGL
ncbi:hypothetical protein ASE56_10385 [Microbacterium sp. Leaf203]|nr:hypothetical protein ASE56_10385 [Microbacterium sp. Leaf203]